VKPSTYTQSSSLRLHRGYQIPGVWSDTTGCILIPQYLDPATQFSLASSALSSYTRKPNPLSLDTHYSTPSDLFSLYASHSPTHIPPLFESLSAEEQAAIRAEQASAAEGRKTIETAAAATIGYDEARKRNLEYERDKGGRDRPSGTLRGRTAGELMREIRWANLGWVYQVCHHALSTH
jgi:alkylated DNA repair protein alkB family protein 1